MMLFFNSEMAVGRERALDVPLYNTQVTPLTITYFCATVLIARTDGKEMRAVFTVLSYYNV